jgi:hypothetical protein
METMITPPARQREKQHLTDKTTKNDIQRAVFIVPEDNAQAFSLLL